MKFFVIILIIVLFALGCQSQKKSTLKSEKSLGILKTIAFQKYKNDTLMVYSPEKKYVLCKKKIDENSLLNPNALLHFFVYEFKTGKIVYEDKISGGHVSWNSEFELIIKKQRGIITSPEDTGKDIFIYDLRKKKKKILSEDRE